MFQRELETAIELARRAGASILDHYHAGFITEHKIGVDNFSEVVTVADREASQIIVEGIERQFPSDGILSEEETDNIHLRLSRERVWIIDPIDGTAGFIDHDGDFVVQIGLACKGAPVLGVLYQPFYDVLSYAVKGGGSFIVRQGGEPERAQTSRLGELRSMTMAISRHHPSRRLSRIIKEFGVKRTVQRGSVGLKVSLLADQTCDLYISPGERTKLWDTCAPQVVLEEAGGRFTDLFGYELRYDTADLQNRNGLLASNGRAHAAAVKRLEPLLREFGRVPHGVGRPATG
jgi:3'(2'), 5'-bisphosphate nucleotidase